METTKDELIQLIKEWIKSDNEIKNLQNKIKLQRINKKKITDSLVNVMKSNEIDCFDIKGGKLIYSQSKTKQTLNKKMLLNSLKMYFSDNIEQAESLSNFILEQRQEKISESIRRKIIK
jgi:hypothetical protein